MIEAWGIELGKAFVMVFLQPLLYWTILLTILTSYIRRKRERVDFGTSIFSSGSEWKKTWLISLFSFLLLSVAIIGLGAVLFPSVILVISALTILLTISGRLHLLSSGYYIGLTILFLSIIHQINVPFIPDYLMVEWGQGNLTVLLLIAVAFLVIEAILCFTTKKEDGFPKLIKGKRGKYIGNHVVKRLTVIPLLIPIPTGSIESFAPWWPLFPLGDNGYSLMLVPFLIGIQQAFHGMFVNEGAKKLGTSLIGLSMILGLLIAGSFYYPILSIVGAIILIVGRAAIQLYLRFIDLEKPGLFKPPGDSLIILSVIPNTPAAKMGLRVGERIEKVHQHPVTNEQEFYDALQENRTFCKLEVRTIEGELRFVQGPLYQGDHYELGLVFVKEKPRFRLYQDLPTEIN
ncbi:hypothetical protein HNQ94_002054 [Salirhabdus euzebyi]|uniref:PDZ domain-containing protein n=1 Tax=Salirhabdus euzebyi TaxID=394506 RepID=A0A841Q5D7_9BACI|nr:PDZ domain-containing protein [Salirhabdus euzebyi]MBB6453605.1 hypothetical protein [Salirhabdus euzebyi]